MREKLAAAQDRGWLISDGVQLQNRYFQYCKEVDRPFIVVKKYGAKAALITLDMIGLNRNLSG